MPTQEEEVKTNAIYVTFGSDLFRLITAEHNPEYKDAFGKLVEEIKDSTDQTSKTAIDLMEKFNQDVGNTLIQKKENRTLTFDMSGPYLAHLESFCEERGTFYGTKGFKTFLLENTETLNFLYDNLDRLKDVGLQMAEIVDRVVPKKEETHDLSQQEEKKPAIDLKRLRRSPSFHEDRDVNNQEVIALLNYAKKENSHNRG